MANDHDRYKVMYLLNMNHEPKHISELVGISYSTVLRYKREYERAAEDNAITELLNMPDAVLQEVMEIAQSRAPVVIDDELKSIAASVTGAQRLETHLQVTAETVSTRIRAMALTAEHAGELCDLAGALCAIQKAFFNPNQTQVLVQNNNNASPTQEKEVAADTYGELLNDKPKNL